MEEEERWTMPLSTVEEKEEEDGNRNAPAQGSADETQQWHPEASQAPAQGRANSTRVKTLKQRQQLVKRGIQSCGLDAYGNQIYHCPYCGPDCNKTGEGMFLCGWKNALAHSRGKKHHKNNVPSRHARALLRAIYFQIAFANLMRNPIWNCQPRAAK